MCKQTSVPRPEHCLAEAVLPALGQMRHPRTPGEPEPLLPLRVDAAAQGHLHQDHSVSRPQGLAAAPTP